MDIIGSQVCPVVQVLFPNNDVIFQDSTPYTQPEVFSLVLRSMKMHLNIFSTSSLASTVAHLKCHGTTVVSFRDQGEKQIPYIITQAARRSVVQYTTRCYSELT